MRSLIVWNVRWIVSVAIALYKKRSVIDLTPYVPWVRARVFWDRRRRKLGRVNVRANTSDYYAYYKNIAGEALRLDEWSQGRDVRELYNECCRRGIRPVIVDCGGNIGMSAYWFASEFPSATVICLEPEQENIALARSNLMSFKNVVCVWGGLSDANRKLRIGPACRGEDGFTTEAAPDGDIVGLDMCTLLDRVMAGTVFKVLIVKIDIEGSEGVVFDRRPAWLRLPAVFIVELHDWLFPFKGTSKGVAECIVDQKLDVVISGEHLVCFRPAEQWWAS